MKNLKLYFSALAVVALVGTALAFKPLTDGSVYCNNTCTTKVDYRIEPTGTVTAPCGASVQPYVINGSGVCDPTAAGIKFKPTSPGN